MQNEVGNSKLTTVSPTFKGKKTIYDVYAPAPVHPFVEALQHKRVFKMQTPMIYTLSQKKNKKTRQDHQYVAETPAFNLTISNIPMPQLTANVPEFDDDYANHQVDPPTVSSQYVNQHILDSGFPSDLSNNIDGKQQEDSTDALRNIKSTSTGARSNYDSVQREPKHPYSPNWTVGRESRTSEGVNRQQYSSHQSHQQRLEFSKVNPGKIRPKQSNPMTEADNSRLKQTLNQEIFGKNVRKVKEKDMLMLNYPAPK